LTFEHTFPKHHFGYTATDYLAHTFNTTKAMYGLKELIDKDDYYSSLAKSSLGFESEDSIYLPLYSNMLVKFDMNLSKAEFQARNG